MELDQKAKDSIKWMAIFGAAASAVEQVVTYFASTYFTTYGQLAQQFGQIAGVGGFPVNSVLNSAVWGAVSGAIFGFVLSKYYASIMEFNRNYLKNFFGSLFKLLFYPYIIAGAFTVLGGLGALAAGAGIGILVIFVSIIVVRYFYAKMVVAKLGAYYQ